MVLVVLLEGEVGMDTHFHSWIPVGFVVLYHFMKMRQELKGNYNGICLYADRAEKYRVQKKMANHFIQLDLKLFIQSDKNYLSNVT